LDSRVVYSTPTDALRASQRMRLLRVGMAFAQPVVPMAPPLVSQLDDHGAGTVGVVGGPLSQLLEQNYAILNQFKQNMEVYKVNENTELLVRFRDNILTVLNQMNAMQVRAPLLKTSANSPSLTM
jgi:hypothetical protein